MPMLAEVVDAVIGIDTHRDSHEVEIADARGTPIATMRISNDSGGFTQLLTTIAEVAPGPRVAVSIEGSRSYGIGLARTLSATGLLVIECEQPARKQRRRKGKSDPIDAHLAVLAALRFDADRLPELRADGDREAQPHPAVMATVAADGRPVTVATWYLLKDKGNVLLALDAKRARLKHMRTDPRMSLTVLAEADWYTHVSWQGRVVSVVDDVDLHDIDSLARHYTGQPYGNRERPRVSAHVEVERWHVWGISGTTSAAPR